MKKETVLIVNNVDIISLNDNIEEPLIPIKPICDALGIAFAPQFSKIKDDPDLSSTVTLSVMVGADGKERKMQCLPLEFVYGWLFSINPKNIKPEAREGMRKYRMECYRALYNHFNDARKFLKEKQVLIDRETKILEEHRLAFNQADKRIKNTRKRLKSILGLELDDWRKREQQMGNLFSEEFREDFENEEE